MISGGLEGRIPYMTYPEPWGGPPKQHPEFLRPAPKPLPPIRYNGVSISPSLNGARLGQLQRSPIKYPSPPSSTSHSITEVKEEAVEDTSYPTYLFAPPPSYHPAYHNSGPYSTLYQPPYTPLLRSNYAPPLSPLEPPYTPNTPSSMSSPGTFLPASSNFNPSTYSPSSTYTSPSTFSPPTSLQPPLQPMIRIDKKPSANFKIPTGKEGSLKHRILTRPGEVNSTTKVALDLQKVPDSPKLAENIKKRITATASPSKSSAKSTNNNIALGENFKKGSLIKLASGEYRKVEDMRTEDFVNSAERSSELRLAESTVVKIEHNPGGTGIVTLSYNQRRAQVEFEVSLEHPFFVYGQGWASCSPDRTLQVYGLKAHRLQVGDILISLTPREPTPPAASIHGSTIITTATTTAVTARQISAIGNQQSEAVIHSYPSIKVNQFSMGNHYLNNNNNTANNSQQISAHVMQPTISQQNFLHPQSSSPDCVNSKKRRWSAPDEICDEDEQSYKKNNKT